MDIPCSPSDLQLHHFRLFLAAEKKVQYIGNIGALSKSAEWFIQSTVCWFGEEFLSAHQEQRKESWLLTHHGDVAAGERGRWARGYVDREKDGMKEGTREREEVFRHKGRGGVFDAKLLIVRHYGAWDDVLCWRECIRNIVNQHILSLCLPLSNIMVYRFVIERLDKSTVLWLEHYMLQGFPMFVPQVHKTTPFPSP